MYQFTAVTMDTVNALKSASWVPSPTPRLGANGDIMTPLTISPNGLVEAGCYTTTAGASDGAWLDMNGVVTTLLTTSAWFTAPQILDINDSGQVVGDAVINGTYQGFVDTNGVVTALNFPLSAASGFASLGPASGAMPPANSTQAQGINDSGIVVGNYTDAMGDGHGYVWQNGLFVQVDDPGVQSSGLLGITNSGMIYGVGGPNGGPASGFTAIPGDSSENNFLVSDQTTGAIAEETGSTYQGPVAGLGSEFVVVTTDNLNITAQAPSSFIHTGSGTDAIDVSKAGGNNVIDGSTGSNFVVGGTGHDTFFVDDRAIASDVWSTIAGFHSGDVATIWGVTAADFSIQMHDNLGAIGYQGLTIEASKLGAPNASVTLTGYSQNDLTDGRLSISYGRTADQTGLPGSTYMQITGH
jgi:hypothetical protein